jgi:hypothetical protein
MPTYRALYYPFIHFRDEAWVRAAALYWDELGRIVPYGGYGFRDAPSITALRDAKFIAEFEPDGADYDVSQAFASLVDEWKGPLKERYSVDEPRAEGAETTEFFVPDGTDPTLAYVNVDKMHPSLRELLEREHLADMDQRPGWAGMHPRMVAVYMTALAQVMASQKAAFPMTDETIDYVSVSGPDVEHIARALLEDVALPKRTARDVEEAMVSVAIESVLPSRLADMPIDEVIDLRNRYAPHRVRFQDGMGKLVGQLSHLEGPMSAKDFDDHVRNEYKKRIKIPLAELSDELHDNHVETAIGLVGTGFAVPAGLGAVLGAAGVVVAPPVGVAIGVAWATWLAVRRMRKADANLEKRNWTAYLLKIGAAQNVGTVASDVGAAARAVAARA